MKLDHTTKHDRTEIVDSLKIILATGQVTELRVLDAVTAADRRPHVESGYFDDIDKLAAAVSTIKSAKGIYIIPNPINPALLSRASNRVRPVGRDPTTADHDIAQRRWLLVDCDAKRPAGISATDDEHDAAHATAQRIVGELTREGWPAPIYADSGNGAHLLFRIDLPADDDGLVQRVLQGLADRFDTEKVNIDTTVYNAARIWKLYGSIAAKGDSTFERPHRMARIIKAPAELIAVEMALLEAVAVTAPTRIQPDQRAPGSAFDLDRWIHEHHLEVDGPVPWQGGRKWIFRTCPWNTDHTNRSAYLLQQQSGAVAAGCHHNGCQGKGWHELRDAIEPGWRERKHNTTTRPTATAAKRRILERRSFPVEVLPAPVANYISEAAAAIGCDASYVGLLLLACLARAIGNTRVIKLKRSWVEAAIIWAAIVGKSGTHKSPALRVAVAPLERKQAEAIAKYVEAIARYEQEMALYQRDFAIWKRAKSTEPPPWEPKEPCCQRYICSDVTIEALAMLLDGQTDGVLVVRDELAGWIDGIGEYKKGGKGSDTGHWLACWSAAPMTVDRKTSQRKMIHIPRAAVSIIGGIQPDILRRAIGREHLQDGLCARLLVAMPPPRKIEWSEAIVSAETEAALCQVLDRLLSLEPAADAEGNPTPFGMQLTPEAKKAWVAYYNRHREEMVDLDDDLCAAWSKLEAYAARFALIIQLCSWAADDGSADQVDQASIEAGIALSDWFGIEARRVYDLLAESDEQREQRELAELISRQGGTITARQLAHSSRAYRAPGEAEAALERLAKVGWGRWSVDADTGGRPANVFVLNGGHGNTTQENAEERRLPLPLPRSADELDEINIRLAEAADEDQAA